MLAWKVKNIGKRKQKPKLGRRAVRVQVSWLGGKIGRHREHTDEATVQLGVLEERKRTGPGREG